MKSVCRLLVVAVALDDRHFAVASDETSVLRVYDSSQPGPARQTFDLTVFLQLDREEPETDLEAAARRAPEAKEGLAIEGLCDTPDGRLLIGFRNSVRDGQALIVPLLNTC